MISSFRFSESEVISYTARNRKQIFCFGVITSVHDFEVITGKTMHSDSSHVPCFLVLEDGTVLKGESFGAKRPVNGEVGK